jgi:hypothetical protein
VLSEMLPVSTPVQERRENDERRAFRTGEIYVVCFLDSLYSIACDAYQTGVVLYITHLHGVTPH